MIRIIFLSFLVLMVALSCFAQKSKLTPGFDKLEFTELLKISTRQGDTLYNKDLPAPEKFHKVHRSKMIGLDNRWELWFSDDSIAAISIRGTTPNLASWTENLFAAMVPATGSLTFSQEDVFYYHLSDQDQAAVHTGWLIGTVSIYRDLIPKLDSCLANGITDFYLIGHSQGGAIATLLTSLLLHLKKDNPQYAPLTIKTYASAAPKTGNLYFAYEYEALTQEGWAFNVVNSADWVPEGPYAIQTIDDFNTINPFKSARKGFKKVPFPKNIAMKYAFNQLDKPTQKATKKFNKYLGVRMSDQIRDYLPNFQTPRFSNTNNYVRTGHTIVLLADEAYYKLFPNDEGTIWQHHKFEPYFYLLEQLK